MALMMSTGPTAPGRAPETLVMHDRLPPRHRCPGARRMQGRRARLGIGMALLCCAPALADPPPIPDAGMRLSAGEGLGPGGRVSGTALDDLGLFDVMRDRPGAGPALGGPQSSWSI